MSRATVSYVLNNTPNRHISEATRTLVLEKARELGHVPHASARALRLGRSNVILALVSDFSFGYVRDEMLATLDLELTRRGYVLLVHRYTEELRPLSELWPLVTPDVVVPLSGLSVHEVATISDARSLLVEVQGVFQQAKAGQMQVEYLHSVGHTSLGYAYSSRPSVRPIADERLAGSEAACRRLGLPPPAVERIDPRSPESVEKALDNWLEGPRRVTAICAHNDELAAMVILAMTRRGLRAGRDLAVMGIDNIPLAGLGITTIAIDLAEVTRRIIERVVAALEDRPAVNTRKPPLSLVKRESA